MSPIDISAHTHAHDFLGSDHRRRCASRSGRSQIPAAQEHRRAGGKTASEDGETVHGQLLSCQRNGESAAG